jgi:Na+/H+ antiporter NhaD/arsenite permease-like protein
MTSGYAIATLVVFIISIFFVIRSVKIPMPRPIPPIPINLTTAPILAIALLWAAQCLDPTVIRNGIVGTEGVKPYNILILFFSLAYMAITLDITGILEAAAYWVSNKGGRNGWKLYLYFYVMLTLVSILLGNDPVILSGTAFLAYYTKVVDLNPIAWIMAEFAAANTASMVLFVGNPTNVVICEGFSVNNAAFTAYTILPFLACNIFCFAALAFQYRNQVPRNLAHTAHQDPWSALRDPFGALVGSFMLGATLILCLVVSFFGIDVWMISLPFAGAKFIFDIGRDHYRYSRRMSGSGSPKAVEEGPVESPAVGNHQPTPDYHTPHPLPMDEKRSMSFPSDEPTAVDSRLQTPRIEADTELQRSSSHPLDKEPAVGSHPETANVEPKAELQRSSSPTDKEPVVGSRPETRMTESQIVPPSLPTSKAKIKQLQPSHMERFPTFFTALPRLPFALIPFAFSQFILIEALNHQGWVNVFADWLVRASHKEVHPTIWLIGVLGVVLCNLAGTNIGATILLTKVVRAASLPYDTNRAAAIALAVASNIGAVSFTFSASLAGLLWQNILTQKGIRVRQRDFAIWNLLPLLAMTGVGLGIVSAEMAVLFRS